MDYTTAVQTVTSCPLCGSANHSGRCPRPHHKRWVCVPCLSLALPLSLPVNPVSSAILDAIKVARTDHHCRRCGVPTCANHSQHKSMSRATTVCWPGDCRRYDPQTFLRYRRIVELFHPGYTDPSKSVGPIRCKVCAIPATKIGLCDRHYSQVRKGKVSLYRAPRNALHAGPYVHAGVYLDRGVYEAAQALAEDDGRSFSPWAARLITAEVERLTGKDFRREWGPSFLGAPPTGGRAPRPGPKATERKPSGREYPAGPVSGGNKPKPDK